MTKSKPKKGPGKAPRLYKEAPEPTMTPESEGPLTPCLGAKLMELLELRGLPVARAAEMAGMTRQQLWRILQGDVPNPGILTVQNIVRSLGGRMKDLFDDGDLVAGGMREIRQN